MNPMGEGQNWLYSSPMTGSDVSCLFNAASRASIELSRGLSRSFGSVLERSEWSLA
jgi:hypothetical protein